MLICAYYLLPGRSDSVASSGLPEGSVEKADPLLNCAKRRQMANPCDRAVSEKREVMLFAEKSSQLVAEL